jgi:hypothetical protein
MPGFDHLPEDKCLFETARQRQTNHFTGIQEQLQRTECFWDVQDIQWHLKVDVLCHKTLATWVPSRKLLNTVVLTAS